MILETMLQRLYAGLARGPGLNARPHRSRQRLDLCDLRALAGTAPESALRDLLGPPAKALEFPARTAAFVRPTYAEAEWSDEQRSAARASDRQARLLTKLRDIAADATDYFNDHGEAALFVGFPLLSLPAARGAAPDDFRSAAILAPALLAPVTLRVRTGPRAGVTLEPAGEGTDLVIPNPALLAWIEQRSGEDTEALLAEEAEDPWAEIAAVLTLVARAAGLPPAAATWFNAETLLTPVPRLDELPAAPVLLSAAVLGLFPLTNPGLLRDTKWMLANQPALVAPVRSFLSPAALAEPTAHDLPAAREWDHTSPPPASGSSPTPATPALNSRPSTLDAAVAAPAAALITHADPCQALAVAHARASDALVIHGPPGTGKSQTIANIIGDHLARGQRVLFVCDKRTALDVVHYRLDAMGLGALCGVIHDPAHDRRDLYLALRERLEVLPQNPPAPDPAADLAHTTARLTALRTELRTAFDRLQGPPATTADLSTAAPSGAAFASFHTLAGQWLELSARATVTLPETEGLTIALLDTHPADADEILRRATRCRWLDNPFRDRLGLSLGAWLALDPATIPTALEHAVALATTADAARPAPAAPRADAPPLPLLPALSAEAPLDAQAATRLQLATTLETFLRHPQPALVATLGHALAAGQHAELAAELSAVASTGALLTTPPDRELTLALAGRPLPLAAVNQHLAALADWSARTSIISRFLAFSAKAAATTALAPLGLTLAAPDALARGEAFYRGQRARWLWSDVRARLVGTTATALAPDTELLALRDLGPAFLAFHTQLATPDFTALAPATLAALDDLPARGPVLVAMLRASAAHAEALHTLVTHLAATGLFTPAALATDTRTWIAGEPAVALTRAWLEALDTLDEAIRLTDRLGAVPPSLRAALLATLPHGLAWPEAETALRATALARELRHRLRTDDTLARIDTARVEAAFAELAERTHQLQALTRAAVLHRWDELARTRLLASTGSRLNSLGAGLRQRLFVRGQRALKLRQMIAAGADTPNGDPLFDLSPVWMASPATVAQIFPRTPLFDVIVFDEASQCRLEEALPVLLRGRRVVIAGDPKQLPPTRFFEQALAESDDTAAETAAEVFEQQQSEAEDLLTAALNLDVQEAFLDVHYRSKHEALIGFSNDAFYSSRLQPIPGHPRHKTLRTPIRLTAVHGVYEERGNAAEAEAAVALVAELLDSPTPPSIGIACFNLPQRDLILDALEQRAAADAAFAARLAAARTRRGRDSFEGLFVKNLENVQGDERDHMIICTTFGPDRAGKFRRNFGALSRSGGERRLNVLVTRARDAIHLFTSIPRAEYTAAPAVGETITGRHQLYAYLRYAEQLGGDFDRWQTQLETARRDAAPQCLVAATRHPSSVAAALGHALQTRHSIGSTVHWGNDGFCVDVALTHPELPEDVTVGLLTDFNRYRKTPDPIAWELFRTRVLRDQGWVLHRLWTPALFRAAEKQLAAIVALHRAHSQHPPLPEATNPPDAVA